MVIPQWLSSSFKESDLARIESAVKSAERGTEAEIVPVIVRSSSTYPQTRVTLTLTGLLVFVILWEAFGGIAHWDAQWPSILMGLAGLIGAIFVFPRLAVFPVVQRLFTVRAEELDQCLKRAELEFYENRVNQTKDGVGVLIFVSLLEHSVIVLADKKISAVLPDTTWQKVVDEVVLGLKSKDVGSGFEKGIEACSSLLKQHFPVKSDDRDELPNKVVIKE